ncbi:Hypothetical predicted protein [Mytilus galloprovincialis]|uniref:Metalloendopeptidase n=1 Tax=Mytilus galloprovincialis TaxID=29158 RepID=A0A8B6EHX6_MYTGA|nr:Hypothetical predicted protein [Mytilus galloprovincialis]
MELILIVVFFTPNEAEKNNGMHTYAEPKGLHILDKNEITAENLDHHLYKQQNLRPRSKEKRNFNVGILDSLWPNGIVPYIVKHSNGASKTLITDSIEEFNKHTCVQWIPRDDQADYVSFEDGGGCGSWIGIVGGKQSITLQDPGCINVETVIHEMCHALGQLHEQSRYDRYPYLRTNWQNIPVMWAYNFDMAYTNNHNPYDQHSVLQYSLSGIAYVVQNNKCTKSAVPIKLRRACVPEMFKIVETTHFGAGSEMLPVHKYQSSYGNSTSSFTVTAQNCYYISYEAYDSQRPAERPRGVVFGITLGIKNPSVFSVPALCKKTVVMQDIPEYQAGKFHPFV